MFSYTPYILLPLFSTVVTASLAIALYRQRRRPAARHVFRLMIILAVWSCSYALNTASTTLPLKVFFYKTATTFTPFLGVFTLAFALELLGYGAVLTRGRLALLAAIPTAAVVLAWTAEYNNLLRYDHFLYTNGPLLLLGYKLGPLWASYYLYVMMLLAASVALFLIGVRRGPAGYRFRYIVLITGIVMIVAVKAAQWDQVDSLQSFLGLEEIMYLAIFVWLAIAGPGPVSIDHRLEGRGKS